MPRAPHPHTPQAELATQHASAVMLPGSGVLSPEVAAFCQSGISVIVALGGDASSLLTAFACGCRVLDDGQLRILLHCSGNEALLSSAVSGTPVAATFSRPITHRSIQVKGVATGQAKLEDIDRAAAHDQMAGLDRELREVDYRARFTAAFCHVVAENLAGIDIQPQAVFAQTPGPGAGAELR